MLKGIGLVRKTLSDLPGYKCYKFWFSAIYRFSWHHYEWKSRIPEKALWTTYERIVYREHPEILRWKKPK